MTTGSSISGRRLAGVLGWAAPAFLILAVAGAPAMAADVGYRDHRFTASSVVDPSGQKPQSKLWFFGGSWWGSLFRPSTEEFRIHRLNTATQTWLDTGTRLDDRNSSEADVLASGNRLYVASASDLSAKVLLFRYSHSPAAGKYVADPGFPVEVGSNAGPVEAVVLDRDTTGRLWVTYTKNQTVHVSHTVGSDARWAAPYALPVAGATGLSSDDISAIVSFDGKIGVMWSNQTVQKMYFAEHADSAADTTWRRSVALQGSLSADDHINLKSLTSDPAGRVFAAVKTSAGDNPANGTGVAQVKLLILRADGSWDGRTFGTVANDHTRPIVLTDRRTRKVYMLATSPTVATSGVQSIYYKTANLDNPVFAPGLGLPLMRSGVGFDVNDVTSTKQDLGQAPGLGALATDDTNYWHNVLNLGGQGGKALRAVR